MIGLSREEIAKMIEDTEALHPELKNSPGYDLYRSELIRTSVWYEAGMGTEEALRAALTAYGEFVFQASTS